MRTGVAKLNRSGLLQEPGRCLRDVQCPVAILRQLADCAAKRPDCHSACPLCFPELLKHDGSRCRSLNLREFVQALRSLGSNKCAQIPSRRYSAVSQAELITPKYQVACSCTASRALLCRFKLARQASEAAEGLHHVSFRAKRSHTCAEESSAARDFVALLCNSR